MALPYDVGHNGTEPRSARDGRHRTTGGTAAWPRSGAMSDRFADLFEAVRRERRRCADEREAFDAFRSSLADVETAGRVESVAAGRSSAAPAAVHAVGPSGGRSGDGVARVCETYRRTVMGVPHYDEEYGEPLAENLAEEFGADVAAAVAGASVLTDDLRDALDDAAATARTEREEFVTLLGREESSVRAVGGELDAAADRLHAIDVEGDAPSDADFDDLRERYDELRDLRRRLDDLAADRQATLADHRRTLSDRVPSVTEFLYPDADDDFPVLAGVAEAGERLDAAERRITSRLSRQC